MNKKISPLIPTLLFLSLACVPVGAPTSILKESGVEYGAHTAEDNGIPTTPSADIPPVVANPPTLNPNHMRILPLGDSITEGNTYRFLLCQQLKAEGYDFEYVGTKTNGDWMHNPGCDPHQDGHSGHRVDEIPSVVFSDAKIESYWRANKPDIILIHLGSNDIFQNQTNASTINDLEDLIDLVRTKVNEDAIFLVAQIIPATMGIPPFYLSPPVDSKIHDLNDLIKTRLSAKSLTHSPVHIVDHWTGYDPASFNSDGIHPNDLGGQHMADKWLLKLKEIMAP